jgi:plasmid stabilization system protein ParE
VQVLFLERARADLSRLRKFLEPHGEAIANRAFETLFAAAQSLEDMPERGHPAARVPYRELLVPFGRSAYVIRYRIDYVRNAVVVVRIWHGRERR